MRRTLRTLAALLSLGLVAAAVAVAASTPAVATRPASKVTENTATLNGVLRSNGAKTFYRFLYGYTPSFGSQSAVRTLKASTSAVTVSAAVGGLLPGTRYYFALQAVNSAGSSTSAARSFRTAGYPPPQPQTGYTTVLSPSSATLTGVVNPNGQATSYWFEWNQADAPAGTDNKTPAGSVPAGSAPVSVSATLYGLGALTSYRFRLVAQHEGFFPIAGSEQRFLTFPSPRPHPRVRIQSTPRRRRERPFSFTTSGRIVPPRSIPRSVSCFGVSAVTFRLGRRVLGQSLANVAPDCTFKTQTVLPRVFRQRRQRRLLPSRISVTARFRGNGYLAPTTARRNLVIAG